MRSYNYRIYQDIFTFVCKTMIILIILLSLIFHIRLLSMSTLTQLHVLELNALYNVYIGNFQSNFWIQDIFGKKRDTTPLTRGRHNEKPLLPLNKIFIIRKFEFPSETCVLCRYLEIIFNLIVKHRKKQITLGNN